MENERPKRITIDELARLMAESFNGLRGEMIDRFEKVDARFEAADRRFAGIDRSLDVLNQKIDRVDQKLDQHRQETKDGFGGVHRLIGGISRTLTDHEERIKALEGE